jgi:hypothetical protein
MRVNSQVSHESKCPPKDAVLKAFNRAHDFQLIEPEGVVKPIDLSMRSKNGKSSLIEYWNGQAILLSVRV